jgi:nucleoside-triphosphatase
MTKNIFVTGKPGSGKTMLIRETCLPCHGRIGGFYTEEMVNGGSRLGFVIKTFDGEEGIFAKKGLKSSCRLNKYGINLDVLERIGVGSLRRALKEKEIIVIDEIGSMEVLSSQFRQVLMECLKSRKRVLATIRYNAQPFTDEVKKMADTELICLSHDSMPEVRRRVEQWLAEK